MKTKLTIYKINDWHNFIGVHIFSIISGIFIGSFLTGERLWIYSVLITVLMMPMLIYYLYKCFDKYEVEAKEGKQ